VQQPLLRTHSTVSPHRCSYLCGQIGGVGWVWWPLDAYWCRLRTPNTMPNPSPLTQKSLLCWQ